MMLLQPVMLLKIQKYFSGAPDHVLSCIAVGTLRYLSRLIYGLPTFYLPNIFWNRTNTNITMVWPNCPSQAMQTDRQKWQRQTEIREDTYFLLLEVDACLIVHAGPPYKNSMKSVVM
jgi:hypothetical protein